MKWGIGDEVTPRLVRSCGVGVLWRLWRVGSVGIVVVVAPSGLEGVVVTHFDPGPVERWAWTR